MALLLRARMPVRALQHGAYAFSGSATNAPKRGPLGHRPGDLLPSLAALIPELPQCKAMEASKLPWVQSAEEFFKIWHKIVPCMGKYQQFLSAHSGPQVGKGIPLDLKVMKQQLGGKTMSDVAQVAIGEFYLCIAFHMRPEEIAAAGSDSRALLRVARECAEEDFEPFIESARTLVADYNDPMHMALEETCPLYEVDDGLFWRANFDITSTSEFQHFLTAVGHGSGFGSHPESAYVKPKDVDATVAKIRDSLSCDSAGYEPARRAAGLVYTKWLEAASMPVKADISKALMEHGFLVSTDVHDGSSKLLPDVPALWPGPVGSFEHGSL